MYMYISIPTFLQGHLHALGRTSVFFMQKHRRLLHWSYWALKMAARACPGATGALEMAAPACPGATGVLEMASKRASMKHSKTLFEEAVSVTLHSVNT